VVDFNQRKRSGFRHASFMQVFCKSLRTAKCTPVNKVQSGGVNYGA